MTGLSKTVVQAQFTVPSAFLLIAGNKRSGVCLLSLFSLFSVDLADCLRARRFFAPFWSIPLLRFR